MPVIAVLLGCVLLQANVRAFVSINLGAESLKTADGTAMPATGLVILVASTTDSTFTPPTADAFVSGDDIVVARFDLSSGDYDGQINATAVGLSLSGNWNAGDPLAVYWFPTLTTNSAAPGPGTSYGFYRDPAADGARFTGRDGSDPWFTPSDGDDRTLLFFTADAGGSNPASAGNASSISPRASTTLAVTSSVNPSLPAQSVTFTAALTASSGTATGSVQFKTNGVAAGASQTLSSGTATFTTALLGHGSNTVVAEYAGNASFLGSTNSLVPAQLVNTPPVATTDQIVRPATEGIKVLVADLLSNDTDADADALSFTSVNSPSANGGTVTQSGGWVFYTPAVGFTNADSFTYTIRDTFGISAIGTVNISVRTNNTQSHNITGIQTVDGTNKLISLAGIPGRTYRIQAAVTVPSEDWAEIGSVLAPSNGLFDFKDTNAFMFPMRFYRSANP